MSWWSDKFKRKEKKQHNHSVAQHVQAKNQVATEYSVAMKKLQTKLTPEERYEELVKTYRHGKDLMVVPEEWRDWSRIAACSSNKIFVNTPVPAIVRTR